MTRTEQRARRAIRMLSEITIDGFTPTQNRVFDNCFEGGDGDKVVSVIKKMVTECDYTKSALTSYPACRYISSDWLL